MNTPENYAHRQNIENYRRQLEAATDEKQRTMLRTLLNEELAKDKGKPSSLVRGDE